MLHRINITRGLPVVLLFVVAACASNTATQPPVTTPISLSPEIPATVPSVPIAPTETATPVTSDEPPTNDAGVQLVARVNGEGITLTQFERALARRQMEVQAADPDTLRDDVLNQLIEQTVIQQSAAAQGLAVSDADLEAELQDMKSAAGTAEDWQQWLATNQFTEDEFRDIERATLTTNRVRDSLTADLSGDVPQVHARHILVQTEAEANAVLSRLQNGEDFATLASSLSLDETTRQSGGDLGWFTQDELLVPQLARAAFALQPGQIGGPVATELGYHIIQTLEAANRPVDPERWVYIAQSRFENWLRPLMDNATIERYI